MHNYYKGDARYSADQPHYITTTASDWKSEAYPTREEAQRWLDCYGVTQRYKEEHYSIVSVAEYWDRRRLRCA